MSKVSELRDTIQDLRVNDPEKLYSILAQLEDQELNEILYDWSIWGREKQQYNPLNAPKITYWQCARGWGKLLCLETPILTTFGWKRLGDIEVGDRVFTESGEETNVTAVYDDAPKKAYRLYFSDSTTIDAGEEHLWCVWDRAARSSWSRSVDRDGPVPENWPQWEQKHLTSNTTPNGPKVLSTQEITESFRHGSRGDINYSIPVAKPLSLPEEDWGIDPWLYGFWLGDGTHLYPSFTVGKQDKEWLVEKLLQLNLDVNSGSSCPKTVGLRGARGIFDGLLGNNKVVPEKFFRGSVAQRLGLLRGLMDSDGYAEKSKVEFTTTKEQHKDLVMWLARSLGDKPVCYEGRSRLNGCDCGPKWRVRWRPSTFVPFTLPRKADKISFGGNQETRNHHRMITDFEEIPVKPMRCLTVDSENHLFLAGESLIPTHNTRTGSEAVRAAVNAGCKNIGLVAPTQSDVRDVMVLGISGLISVFPPDEQPTYEPSYSRVTFPNGAIAHMYSAEKAERLRGPQHDFCWMDEPASINNRDVFDQMMIGNRIGIARTVITGTPLVNEIVLGLHRRKEKDVEIRYGGIRENENNLSSDYVDDIYEMYAGTHLEQSELEGNLVLSNPGALWTPDLVNQQTVPRDFVYPDFEKVRIGVDPATSAKKTSDKTGIVVSALGTDGYGYILEDHTKHYTPEGWSSKVVQLYDYYSRECSTSIVVENNQGGQMCADNLYRNRPLLPVDSVFATHSKLSRAEPVALMFEQGKVWMARGLSDLTQEMISFEGKSKEKSPDHLDAMVYSILHLMPVRNRFAKVSTLEL